MRTSHSSGQKKRKGFTLIELLLVIAIIAILAGILANAINIPTIFINSQDSARNSHRKELENALYQHLIDQWELSTDIPEGTEGDALPICKYGVSASGCVNLDILVDGEYLAALPTDVAETDQDYTGYSVYVSAGRPQVVANHLGESGNPVAMGGSGTPADPYQLSTCDHLQQMDNDLSANYLLVSNVNCSGYDFSPVGLIPGSSFTGELDGGGFVISNLSIVDSNGFHGLMRQVDGASIHDLGFQNITLGNDGGGDGAVAGITSGSPTVIERVYVQNANITGGGGDSVGGIVGVNYANLTLRDCYVTGSISGAQGVGGIVGAAGSTVIIDRCYSTADVTNSFVQAGGVIGSIFAAASSTITDSYAVGPVTCIGGACGGQLGNVVGLVSDASSQLSGIRYAIDPGSDPTTCYSGGDTNCTQDANASDFYGSANTVYTNWDFVNIWQEDAGGYPTLQ